MTENKSANVKSVKPKVKPKAKSKAKSTSVKSTSVKSASVKSKAKESKDKSAIVKEPKVKGKFIVEMGKENDVLLYSNKLKHLVSKIKNQNDFNDNSIRFAWKNN